MPVSLTTGLNANVNVTQGDHSPGLIVTASLPSGSIRRRLPVGEHGQRHRRLDDGRLGEELVVRPEDLRPDRPDVRLEADELDGELVLVLRGEERVGGVVARRPDPPAQVGDSETRQETPLVVVDGRERHRDVEDDGPDPVLPRHLPERRPLAVVHDRLERLRQQAAEAVREEGGREREAERDQRRRLPPLQDEPADEEDEEEREARPDRRRARLVPAAEEEALLPLGDDRELGPVGLRVALEEVEDQRPAGGEAGRERRPGDGGLGRDRRPKREKLLPGELRQVRQLPLGDHLGDEPVVGPVESEDDDPSLHLLRRGGRGRDGEKGEEGGREKEAGGGSGGPPEVRHAAF